MYIYQNIYSSRSRLYGDKVFNNKSSFNGCNEFRSKLIEQSIYGKVTCDNEFRMGESYSSSFYFSITGISIGPDF
jgi:hypothetical protein